MVVFPGITSIILKKPKRFLKISKLWCFPKTDAAMSHPAFAETVTINDAKGKNWHEAWILG